MNDIMDSKPLLYKGYRVAINLTTYLVGDKPVIELICADPNKPWEMGEPYTIATVNIPELRLFDNSCVAIKNYSENEGMLEFLIKHGIVSEPVFYVQRQFVTIPICKLLDTD